MRRYCIKFNQKIQHQKTQLNLLFLDQNAYFTNQLHTVYFSPQHNNGMKKWHREKWFWLCFHVVLVGELTTLKNKN